MAAATVAQKRTDIDVESFRVRLLEEKRVAEETIEATRRAEGSPEAPGVESDTAGMGTVGTANRIELSGVDNHPADNATELFLREEDMALVENARQIIVQIDRALAKIAEGTYGLSDRSGQPIPVERLEALPYASLLADEAEA